MKDLEDKILNNLTKYDAEEFHRTLSQYPMTTGLIVYRGDNRDFKEISSKGFSPWNTMKIENLKSLVAYFVNNKQFRIDFGNWWKYPSTRTIDMKQNPFVATGTSDAHYGKFEYEIQLNQFHVYQIQSGLFTHKIGFDGDSLDTSSIIALQIDKEEVIFGTTIPPRYISIK